ncbi:hypothetical protein ACP3XC_00010 [Vibrio anguillarum]|uniref:hypothetical protein n=1 Tax=Vibrio anguillarum TaxID=55601 RepID=UPI003CEEF485
MSILESAVNQSVRTEKWCQKLASRVVPIKDGAIYHFSDHSFYEVNQKPVLPIVKPVLVRLSDLPDKTWGAG